MKIKSGIRFSFGLLGIFFGSTSLLASDSFIQSEGLTKEVLPPWYSIQKGKVYNTSVEGRTLREFILRAKASVKTSGAPVRVPGYPIPDLQRDFEYPWKLWVKIDSHLIFPKHIDLRDPNGTDPNPRRLLSGYGLNMTLQGFENHNILTYILGAEGTSNIIRNEYPTDTVVDQTFQGPRVTFRKRFVIRGALTPVLTNPCTLYSSHYRYEITLWSVLGSTGEFRHRITAAPLPPAVGVAPKCAHAINSFTQDALLPRSIAKYVSLSEDYDPVLGTVSKVGLLKSTFNVDKELSLTGGLPLKIRGWREEIAIGNENRGLAFVIPRYECLDVSQTSPVTLSVFNHFDGALRVARIWPLCKRHVWDVGQFTSRTFDLAVIPFPARPLREVLTPSGALAPLNAEFMKFVSGVLFQSKPIYGDHSDQAVYKIGFGLPVKYYGLPFLQKITSDPQQESKINFHRGKFEGTLDQVMQFSKSQNQYVIPYSSLNILPTKLPSPWASHATEDSYDLSNPTYIKAKNGVTTMGVFSGFFEGSSMLQGTKWAPFLFPWIANQETPNLISGTDYNPYGFKQDSTGVVPIKGELRYGGNAAMMGICPMMDDESISRCRDGSYWRFPVTFRAMCATQPGYRQFMANLFRLGKTGKGLPDSSTQSFAAQGGYFDATNSPVGCRDPLTSRLAGEPGAEQFKYSSILDRRELVRGIYGQTVVHREAGVPTGYLDATYAAIHHVAKPIYSINTFSDAILTGERLYQPFFRALYDLPDGTNESSYLDLSRFTDATERQRYLETQFIIAKGLLRPSYCKPLKDLGYRPKMPSELPYCPNYSLVPIETYAFNYAPGTHGFVNFMLPQVFSGGDINDTKLGSPELEQILFSRTSEDLIKHSLVFGFPVIPSRVDSTLIREASLAKLQAGIRPGTPFTFAPASQSGLGNGKTSFGSEYKGIDGRTLLKFEYAFPYRTGQGY